MNEVRLNPTSSNFVGAEAFSHPPRAPITEIPQGEGPIFVTGSRVIRTRLQQIP